jgi:Flp pilus assembly pilin Flp
LRGFQASPLQENHFGDTTTLGGESMSRRKRVFKLIASSRGQTMAEYALILVTIAVIAAALVQTAGVNINGLIHNVVVLL